MKKLFVSAGLMAIGATALQSAMADDAGPKYWIVGATLRGFYDDNYNIGNSTKGSFGTEVLPTVSAHLPLGQTDIGIRYTYGLYYYENRDEIGVTPIDQTQEVDVWLNHAFNERWSAKFSDTIASGQEPELLNAGNPNGGTGSIATPYRINGDNIANHGTVEVDTIWTRLFSTALTYNNGYYQYQNSGAEPVIEVDAHDNPVLDPTTGKPIVVGLGTLDSKNRFDLGQPSLAGLLNRDEESVALDLKWTVLPETIVFIGYSLGWVNYTGNEIIDVPTDKNGVPLNQSNNNNKYIYYSSARDNVSHTGYLGVSHDFAPNLTAMIKGGATLVDNYADPIYASTSWAPYADLSLAYTYLPGSYLKFGFTQDEGASDQVKSDYSGHITEYTENSVVYLDLNHAFTRKLSADLIARVQYSTYNAGAAANADTTDYGLGLNVTYLINNHISVDAGYNYDDVESDLAGYGYNRNRVYLGLTATY